MKLDCSIYTGEYTDDDLCILISSDNAKIFIHGSLDALTSFAQEIKDQAEREAGKKSAKQSV